MFSATSMNRGNRSRRLPDFCGLTAYQFEREMNDRRDAEEANEVASEAHLEDLDQGGYPDASATELLNPPDRYVPVSRQVLYSSLAVEAQA